MQPRAGDQEIGFEFARRGRGHPARSLLAYRFHPRARDYAGAAFGEPRDQSIANLGIVHDAFLRHAQRGDAAHVGLNLAHLLAGHPAQAFQTVGDTALVEGAQAGRFGLIHRHHELAADLVRNGILLAELHHLANPRDGQARLHRSRFVVQPAVQHAAVMARLVAAHARLLFQHADARPWKAFGEAIRRRQSHDAAADNYHSLGIHG